MRVNFEIAKPEFEARKLYSYIRNYTKKFDDFMFTKLEIKIDENLYNKIKKEDFEIVSDELIRIVKTYPINIKVLKKIVSSWKKIEKKLFDAIKDVTGHEIVGDFSCFLLSSYHSGGYDVKSNSLWIHHLSDDKKFFWGVTHELLHIHCWKIFDKLFSDYNRDKAWRFSEVYVELLLRDTDISFILPKSERSIKFWDEVKPMAEKVLPLWKSRNDFDSFLVESFEKLELD